MRFMLNVLLPVAICLAVISCSKTRVFPEKTTILKNVYASDILEGKDINYSPSWLTNAMEWKDRYIFVDRKNKMIIFTDKNMKLIDTVGTKKVQFMFKGDISSAELYKDALYILDRSYKIKKYSLKSGDFVNCCKYSIALSNISVINDSSYICGYASIRKRHNYQVDGDLNKKGIDAFLLGYIVQNNKAKDIYIDCNKMDYDQFVDDACYVKHHNGNIYLTFNKSRKIIQCDMEGKINKIVDALVDKNWERPKWIARNGQKVYQFRDIFNGPIECRENKFYQTIYDKSNKNNYIIEYSANLEPVRTYITNLPTGSHYQLSAMSDNTFVIYSILDPNIYKFIYDE